VRRGGDAPLAGSMHNGGGYFLVGIYVNLEVYSWNVAGRPLGGSRAAPRTARGASRIPPRTPALPVRGPGAGCSR
jgi:hypothetical protein